LALKNETVNLTIGSLWSNIWHISWPMLLIMVFNFFVGLTDVYVAGFIGPEVQAAVGFVGQLYFFTIIVANAISIGTLALVARAVGAGHTEKSLGIARQSLIFSLLIAAGLTITVHVFYKEIIFLAGFPTGTREIAEKFLRIFALALGPNYVLIISSAVFRASGDVKKPLVSTFLVSIINILGDFILVFGLFKLPKLGYTGIALSTAGSVLIGMFINLSFFTRDRWRSFYGGPWNISLETIRKIISVGWPAALLQVAWNAGTIVLYSILGRLGAASITAIASITNGLRIEAVIYLPAFALNMSASVLIGQNLGAGNAERAEKVGWKIAQAGAILVTVMALAIFIWADNLASLLTKNRDVLIETSRYLKINMVSEPFMALGSILGGGLQGAGDTIGTMWIIGIAMWLIRLPLSYFLAFTLGYGALGVWVAMIISMTCQGILLALRFHKGQWKKMVVD
jgi:multidrug resistance protein, MATE family